jgi:outer membrane protein with beta-barrel domain
MKKFLLLPFLACATLSANVFAESPNWTYVQASYLQMNVDDEAEIDFKGYAVAGSALINETFFATGKFSAVDDNEQKYDQLNLGIGAKRELNESTDFYGVVAYEKTKFDFALEDETENAYSTKLGLRSMVTEHLDVNAAIGMVNSNGSETLVEVDAFYSVGEGIALGLEYGKVGDFSSYAATIRYEF